MEKVESNADRLFMRNYPHLISPRTAAALDAGRVSANWIRTEFIPSDEVIISDILTKKVRGSKVSTHILTKKGREVLNGNNIKEIDSHDIYGGGKHPSDLFSMYAKNKDLDHYVHLITTPPPASSFDEDGHIGPWALLEFCTFGTRESVEDPRLGNQVVGYKKFYMYDDESSRGEHYGWFMTEYSTLQPPLEPSLNAVLCKLEKIEFLDGVVEEEEPWEEEEGELELDAESAKAAEAAADAAAAARAA